jgi:hypothetical protein
MDKKDHEREKMLAELFHDNWADGPAGEFARTAAALARRRRGNRRAFAATGIAAGIAAVLISIHQRPAPTPEPAAPAKIAPAYEIISDDELLARLPDRSLLVLRRENGSREFVLLDR